MDVAGDPMAGALLTAFNAMLEVTPSEQAIPVLRACDTANRRAPTDTKILFDPLPPQPWGRGPRIEVRGRSGGLGAAAPEDPERASRPPDEPPRVGRRAPDHPLCPTLSSTLAKRWPCAATERSRLLSCTVMSPRR